MKRVFVGAGWCLVLWFGFLMVGGAVLGAVAGAGVADPQMAAELGRSAGANFGEQYGVALLLGAATVSVVGTITGWLPGTEA